MIIYTNEGNPLGLKLLLVAKFAKKDVQIKFVTLNGELSMTTTEISLDRKATSLKLYLLHYLASIMWFSLKNW
jgi:Glutathione S-transferase, N-terminal domain